jgi:preprotein translocase subunit YajC
MELVNWFSSTGPLMFIVIVWVGVMVFLRWKMQGGSQNAVKKQTALLEQQLVVLREINETLKQLRASRG